MHKKELKLSPKFSLSMDEDAENKLVKYFHYYWNTIFTERIPKKKIAKKLRVKSLLSILDGKFVTNELISKSTNTTVKPLLNSMPETEKYESDSENPENQNLINEEATSSNGQTSEKSGVVIDIKKFETSYPKDLQNILLYIMIESVTTNPVKLNLEVIEKLSKNTIKILLRLFSIYSHKSNDNLAQLVVQNVNVSIDYNLFKLILRRWKGWLAFDFKEGAKKYMCLKLAEYLIKHLKNVQLHKWKYIKKELSKYDTTNLEHVMIVSTRLKDLKTFFYFEPMYHNQFFIRSYAQYYSAENDANPNVKFLLNWPYVSTQLTLPHFSMTHRLLNTNKFTLVNLTENFKTVVDEPKSINLFCFPKQEPLNNPNTYQSSFIARFLLQLETVVKNTNSIILDAELLRVLNELKKDVELCVETISVNTDYRLNLVKHPYMRYLGTPSDGAAPPISFENQTETGSTNLNIRLQQFSLPVLSFVLEEFGVAYEEDEHGNYTFFFPQDYFDNSNIKIKYKCTLCNEAYDKWGSSVFIITHLLNSHGVEPDWSCSACNSIYTTRYLSENRWHHECRVIVM